MKDCLDYFNYIAQVLVVLCTAEDVTNFVSCLI